MDPERWWPPFVDVAAVVWMVLFAVALAAGHGLVDVSAATVTAVRRALRWLFVVFLLDIALLYRWSEKRPWPFVRTHWFLVLTVVPWFRPLRVLRVGRGLRALKALSGSRRVGALYNKARRTVRRYWKRLRE